MTDDVVIQVNNVSKKFKSQVPSCQKQIAKKLKKQQLHMTIFSTQTNSMYIAAFP
jgi:hypothetical protein